MMETQTIFEVSTESKMFELQKVTRLISNSDDLYSACLILEDYLSYYDLQLRSVVFGRAGATNPENRAFRKDPQVLVNLSAELRETNGCPVFGKASRLRHAFDALQMRKDEMPCFLSKRYLDELAKLGHKSIAVIPIGIGSGLAAFSIGMGDKYFAGELRASLVYAMCQISIAIISRFPDVTKLFETRCLSTFEAEVMLLCANGFSNSEIAQITNLSERSVNMLFDNAALKLGARNQAHAISKSLAKGEISNLQLGLEYIG
ncbi:MAG: helix-turn-helix transcriptional regulator [Pseudomonadota bacterium]